MTDARLCLGLHITKCAGTSLMTTLRRTLSEDEYYFFSSYYENWLASRPLFAGIRSPERLRIVFGHYCHEALLSVFADRRVFLFTGLRDPIERAVSGLRQVNAVAAQSGRAPVGADAYLAGHRNPVCGEILRCFPNLAGGPDPLWKKARAALSLFDFVTDTDRFDEHAVKILEVIDGPARAVVSDNLSAEKTLSGDADHFVARACDEVRARAAEHMGDDIRLYWEMRDLLGVPDLRANIRHHPWAIDRAAFVAAIPGPAQARLAFGARETEFMLSEFADRGRLPELRAWLRARADEAEGLARRIVVPG